jgi:hypothetical protein
MELRAELSKYEVKLAEDCKQLRLKLQSRIKNNKPEIEGADLGMFDDPENASAKKVVFQNIPLLTEICQVDLVGDGQNNFINIGNITLSGLEARVKKIDEEYVAILAIVFAGLTATEQLVAWVYHNIGKTITVKMDKVQQELDFTKDKPKKGRPVKAAA